MSSSELSKRLSILAVPGAGWTADQIVQFAREAENTGFQAVFSAEVNSDPMAVAQLMGSATSRIQVGTFITNLYLRHSYVCARNAALIGESTGGRFLLGIGVSHQPVNAALGIDMAGGIEDLRRYATEVQCWLRGEGPATHLPQQPCPQPVPVHMAALTSRTVELAAEVADGVMPVFWSPERVRRSSAWIERGLARRGTSRDRFQLTLGLPVFVGDDLAEQRDMARQYLGLYTTFPFFQRLFRLSGFVSEADAMEKGLGPAALSDELLDSVCLIGPLDRCQARLGEYYAAGVDLPVLYPPVGFPDVLRVIDLFGTRLAATQ